MTVAKGIHIDSSSRTVTLVDWDGVGDMQKRVGGYIEVAWSDGTDVLYVDEEGLLKQNTTGFSLFGKTCAGNGLLVGAENQDEEGDLLSMEPPRLGPAEIEAAIRWVVVEPGQAEASVWSPSFFWR